MDEEKDVDKVLLDLAGTMVPCVQMNGHPDVRTDRVGDIPWLVVLVFELITANTMPTRFKKFDTLEDRARTLQTVIDTLEKAMLLPMSHVTGRDVAKLDRQQILFLLEILSGLVDHCFPQRRKQRTDRQTNHAATERGQYMDKVVEKESPDVSPMGRRLTISQLATPERANDDFSTPPLHALGHVADLKTGRYQALIKPQQNHIPTREAWMPRSYSDNQKSDTHTDMRRAEDNSDYIEMAPCPNRTDAVTVGRSILTSVPQSAFTSYSSSSSSSTTAAATGKATVGGSVLTSASSSSSSSAPAAVRVAASGSVDISALAERNTNIHEIDEHHRRARQGVSLKPSVTHVKQTDIVVLDNSDKHHKPLDYTDKDVKQLIEGKSSGRVPSKQPSAVLMLSPKKHYQSDKGKTGVHSPIVQRKDIRKPSIIDKYAARYSPYSKDSVLRRHAKNIDYTSPFAKDETKQKPIVVRKPNIKSFQAMKQTTSKAGLTRNRSSDKRKASSNRGGCLQPLGSDQEKQSVRQNKARTPVFSIQKEITKEAAKPPKDRLPSKPKYCPRKTSIRLYPSTHAIAEKKKSETFVWRSSVRSLVKSPTKFRSSRRQSGSDVTKEGASCYRCSPVVVVSTKARKRSACGNASPVFLKSGKSPVKRGDVSPQTSSLCSSLRLLHEFDYVKRRLEQIQRQKQEYEAAIQELEHEEVRLSYLVSHVHFQAGKLSSVDVASAPAQQTTY